MARQKVKGLYLSRISWRHWGWGGLRLLVSSVSEAHQREGWNVDGRKEFVSPGNPSSWGWSPTPSKVPALIPQVVGRALALAQA